jgi:hypothetical protein
MGLTRAMRAFCACTVPAMCDGAGMYSRASRHRGAHSAGAASPFAFGPPKAPSTPYPAVAAGRVGLFREALAISQ